MHLTTANFNRYSKDHELFDCLSEYTGVYPRSQGLIKIILKEDTARVALTILKPNFTSLQNWPLDNITIEKS
jgi:hypothetical protein